MAKKFVAGPNRELISRVYGATAVEQDASFVLDSQQIRLILVTGIINVPVWEVRIYMHLVSLFQASGCNRTADMFKKEKDCTVRYLIQFDCDSLAASM